MAFANSSISDIIATNIQSRTGELADNVTNNNALLRRLKERGTLKRSPAVTSSFKKLCTRTRQQITRILIRVMKC
jgi:hypothetical protein